MTLSQAAQAERQMESCICGPVDWVGRISTPADDGEASTWVCGLRAHQSAARAWVELSTRKPAMFIPKATAS